MEFDFHGKDRMISAFDSAFTSGDEQVKVDSLRRALCKLANDGSITLPPCTFEALPGRYARRLLYTSPKHGYCVVAMTWGAGQGAKIHDHSGMWCVEGIWYGRLEITQYELTEHEHCSSLHRFTAAGTIEAGAGSAGSLIPPYEYHSIRNPSDTDITISIHVYERTMERCGVYQYLVDSDDAGGYFRDECVLAFDF